MEKRGMSQELPEDDDQFIEEMFEKDATDEFSSRVINKNKQNDTESVNTESITFGTVKCNKFN